VRTQERRKIAIHPRKCLLKQDWKRNYGNGRDCTLFLFDIFFLFNFLEIYCYGPAGRESDFLSVEWDFFGMRYSKFKVIAPTMNYD
jgi:hypothetical protein